MSGNFTKRYPDDFLAEWEGCSHLDCLPACRHGLESGHCERLERAFAEFSKDHPTTRLARRAGMD